MRIIVFGGRNFFDRRWLFSELNLFKSVRQITLLISGGASGADTLAKEWATYCRIPKHIEYAEWTKYMGAAGPIRNQKMIELNPNVGIQFPGGRGTDDMRCRLNLAKIPVWEPDINDSLKLSFSERKAKLESWLQSSFLN